MEHNIREEQGKTVVCLKGDVDLESSPVARKVLLDCVKANGSVLVDMSEVAYIDSSGVASLVESYQATRTGGGSFALVAVSPSAMRVLELARLDKVFPIYETIEAALQDVA